MVLPWAAAAARKVGRNDFNARRRRRGERGIDML